MVIGSIPPSMYHPNMLRNKCISGTESLGSGTRQVCAEAFYQRGAPCWTAVSPSLVSGFPPLRSSCQRFQDTVDGRSLGRHLVPTGRRHFPEFVGVAASERKVWCWGSNAFDDMIHCHKLPVSVERDFVSQDLERVQGFGGISIGINSPHRSSSPLNIYLPFSWDYSS